MNPVYDVATINGKILGSGDPVKVKQGERVMMHILNSSPTEFTGFRSRATASRWWRWMEIRLPRLRQNSTPEHSFLLQAGQRYRLVMKTRAWMITRFICIGTHLRFGGLKMARR
jgi:hypothetical protein